MSVPVLILASGSQIRRQLLHNAGLDFEVLAADIDEAPLPNEAPEPRARRLAREKALVVSVMRPDAWVLGCDQTGVTEAGLELSKCENVEDALAQLMAMSGRTHRFTSAAALVHDQTVQWEGESTVRVCFRPFSEETAHAYLQSGEWRGSAGSYQLENRGIQLVESVEGSTFAVLGLPLHEVLGALRKFEPRMPGLLPGERNALLER